MSGFDETLLDDAGETVRVRFVVNGRKVACEVAPRETLVDCLRNALELTGTHAGCEMGPAAPAWCSSTAALCTPA